LPRGIDVECVLPGRELLCDAGIQGRLLCGKLLSEWVDVGRAMSGWVLLRIGRGAGEVPCPESV